MRRARLHRRAKKLRNHDHQDLSEHQVGKSEILVQGCAVRLNLRFCCQEVIRW
jgi:hypothetical protein